MCIRDRRMRVTDAFGNTLGGQTVSVTADNSAMVASTVITGPDGTVAVSYTHLDVYKRQFRLRLLLLMVAVTALSPAVWLVTEISTVPSGCVLTVGATVAPLSANSLTVCPASALPNASVTLARSVFAVAPVSYTHLRGIYDQVSIKKNHVSIKFSR